MKLYLQSAIVIVTIFLIPDIKTGNAKGNLILNSCCNFVLPIPSDASIIKGFIFIIPVYVLLIIGKSAYIIKAISAVVFPTPVIVNKKSQ